MKTTTIDRMKARKAVDCIHNLHQNTVEHKFGLRGNRYLVLRYWELGIGNWELGIGYWSPITILTIT